MKLYAQAKRLGIERRSKLTKAQLERAVSRQKGRKTSGGKQKANPFEVQEFLEAVGYPAGKRQLVREAKEQGAGARLRSTHERLPDKEFGTPAELSEASRDALGSGFLMYVENETHRCTLPVGLFYMRRA